MAASNAASIRRYIAKVEGLQGLLEHMGIPVLISKFISYLSTGGINCYYTVEDGKLEMAVDGMTWGKNVELPFTPLDGSSSVQTKNPAGIDVSVPLCVGNQPLR